MIKIWICPVLFLLVPDVLVAQDNNMAFYYLTTDDGLSDNRVSCIFRDSRDYVWIGTEDGLNKYNGYDIVVYRKGHGDPKSICNNRIMCIAEDAENNIWVGTRNGVSTYSANDDSFTSFNNIEGDTASISSNFINCFYLDKDRNFWIGGSHREGLNKWDPASKTFIRYSPTGPLHEEQHNAINSIVEDKKGNLWLASRLHEGIVKFEPSKSKFTRYAPGIKVPDDKKFLFVDNEGIIWISTFGSGLYTFNPETQQYTSYNTYGNGKGTNSKVISNFTLEEEHYLLMGADQGGINRFNKQTGLFEYITYNPGEPSGLNNNGIWYLYKDKENILWVGTAGGGVNIYNPKSEKFRLLRNIPQKTNSLCYSVVNSMYEDSKGLIWINTDGGGVSAYNPLTGNFKNYKANHGSPGGLPSGVIRHVVEDKNHDHWFGAWEGGLIKLDHHSGKFTQYLPNSSPPFNISGPTVWYHMIDHKGIIWLSIFNVGIDLLDPDKGIVKRIRLNPNKKDYCNDAIVRQIYEDSHNNIWFCTNAGLKILDPVTFSINAFHIFSDGRGATSFLEDAEGHYWAGSKEHGLARFTSDGTILQTYSVMNGLPNNTIHGILEDGSHHIWISTNNGISRINYKTGHIKNYSKSDGLQGNQFLIQSCLKTKSGEMYLGGTNGLNSFFPDSIKNNDHLPEVYINEFLIFNKPVPVGKPGSPLHKTIEQTREITLNWKQSVFSLGFTAINYTHPEKNVYAYKMEGFDKDWNITGANRRLATYTNLNPGIYTFRVKATNNDGVWNEREASVHVIIIPPFWQTLWFKGLVIIFLFSSTILGFRLRVRSIKKRSEAFEKLVIKRTEQLHAANKELEAFAYSVSHDLRAPLRGIDGFSEILQEEYHDISDEQKQHYLGRIRSAAQRMAQLIDDLLDLSRISRSEIKVKDVDISCIARDILYELCQSQPGREVEINIEEGMVAKADDRLLQIALENLLGNAWKFTSKRAKASVQIGKQQQENKTVYFVRDNGAGFDMKYAQKLFGAFMRLHAAGEFPGTGIGLATVQRVVHRHGGKVWAESEKEKGATFYFTLQ